MPALPYAIVCDSYRARSEDRAAVVALGDALLIAVADGAGGISGGEEAADLVVRRFEAHAASLTRPPDGSGWVEFLAGLDAAIAADSEAGETTGVVLTVTADLIEGTSVGDSEAWLIDGPERRILTAGQRRKPFLGSGMAAPVPFRWAGAGGVLVVGTDGLFKYAPVEAIAPAASLSPPADAGRALINLARLRTGQLPDDIVTVVCQRAAGDDIMGGRAGRLRGWLRGRTPRP